MRIRSGFVSNSSSSNFIVGFDHKPKDAKELKEILFGKDEVYVNPYPEYSDIKYWQAQEVADIVFNDMKEPIEEEKVVGIIESGSFDGEPEYPAGLGRPAWEEYAAKRSVAANRYWNSKMKSKFAGKQAFEFHYSDNDGELGSAMEHGYLFDRLPHITISNH
jgi:hypothetical protein